MSQIEVYDLVEICIRSELAITWVNTHLIDVNVIYCKLAFQIMF